MRVRPHMSQHEKAEKLPLVTESAAVTDITVMDRNRKDELVSAVDELVDSEVRVNGGEVDWDELVNEVGGKERERLRELRERYERPYPSLMSIRFKAEEDFDFVAGQYVTIRFHDTPRPYSLASSPNDETDEVCIKRVPEGRLTSELFKDIREGSDITVRGPNGEFMLQNQSARDMVFLATGTGVAPIRSMIRYLFQEGRDIHKGERRNVWLFLGASWKDDLPYRSEFRVLEEERDNFHFVPTLSRENYLTDWNGETKYVQDVFVKYLDDQTGGEPAYDIDTRIDKTDIEVYACGVTAMVESVVASLEGAGVPDDCIEAEGYG